MSNFGRFSQSLTRWPLNDRDRHEAGHDQEPELHHSKGLSPLHPQTTGAGTGAAMTAAPEPGSPPARADCALPEHDMTERLRALADPTRLRLLAALRAVPQQRACVTDLTRATGLAQPTVSRHLQVLHRAALLTRTRDGSRA